MKVETNFDGVFIETDRIKIEINETEYDIIHTDDDEIRILKQGNRMSDGIIVIPEVSNVIKIK